MKNIWTIGGIDPGSRAGIIADSFITRYYRNSPTSICSSVTSQNNNILINYDPVSSENFKNQLELQLEQKRPDAIKVSLLGSLVNLKIFIDFYTENKLEDVILVFDPIVKSTSGGCFKDPELIEVITKKLLTHVDFITPNLDEALYLSGKENEKDAALFFRKCGVDKVLIKGGIKDEMVWDYYKDSTKDHYLWQRKITKSYRGTGCHLASLFCNELFEQRSFTDALIIAKAKLNAMMKRSTSDLLDPSIKIEAEDMPYINTRDRFIHYENSPEVNLNKLEVYPVFADFNTISELSEGLQTVQLRVKGRDPKKRN